MARASAALARPRAAEDAADELMAAAGGGEIVNVRPSGFQDHPAGGCRMGADPGASVVDPWGRAHDHENLFVVGAPTCVSAGCANGVAFAGNRTRRSTVVPTSNGSISALG